MESLVGVVRLEMDPVASKIFAEVQAVARLIGPRNLAHVVPGRGNDLWHKSSRIPLHDARRI